MTSKSHVIESMCKLCGKSFMSSLPEPMRFFCPLCRNEWSISSIESAEEMAMLLDKGVVEGVDEERRQRSLPAAKVKINPVEVANGVRAMTDHKVAPVHAFEKPITYVTCKNGLFEVRHSDLATITTKPKEVLGIVEEGVEGITLNVPKIPFEFLVKTIAFFRGVCEREKGSSEALVQVWWDRQEKQHILHVPEQQVSGGSVRHESVFDNGNEGRWLHVADIHSHGSSMNAFWSSIDDHDERRVTTERLFGVIGKVTQPIPEWKWRMRTRDGFIDLTIPDLFEVPEGDFNFSVKSEVLFRTLSKPDAFKDGSVLLWCPVEPFPSVEVPEEWYTKVRGFSSRGGRGHQIGFGQMFGRGGEVRQFPNVLRGYIYINGDEYEVDGESLKATGHRLLKKGEVGRKNLL